MMRTGLLILLLLFSIARPALPISLAPLPWLPTCAPSFARVASSTMDYFRDEFLYREHVIDGKHWHEVLIVEEYPLASGLVTRVVRREVREGTPSAKLTAHTSKLAYNELRQWHLDFARSIVALTIEKYQKRRNWGPEFRQKLYDMAENYLNDSIYVGIVEKATNTVVGGKRYILAPYGMVNGQLVADGQLVRKHYGPVSGFRDPKKKPDANDQSLPLPPSSLPEADYLGIDLPRSAILPTGEPKVKTGMQVEIGALVVEESLDAHLRGKIWADLHLQDLRMAFEDENDDLTYGGISFHAYADPLSRKMYVNDLNWGWELLNGYKKDGQLVTFQAEKEAPVIEKEGTPWVPIIFHPERMEDYHLKFVKGEIPRAEYVNVSERQRDMGPALGGAEVVETFDALLDGLNSGYSDVVAASAVGLIRLAYRQHLSIQKKEDAAINPENLWRASSRFHEDPEIPKRIIKAMDQYLASAQTDSEKVMILSMVGQMIDLKLSQSELLPEALRDRYLLPLLSHESFTVRAAALAHLQRQFSPLQVAHALQLMPEDSKVRVFATRELRRGRLHNLLLTEVDQVVRNWGKFRKQLDLNIQPMSVLEWMAEVSDRLDGVYREYPMNSDKALMNIQRNQGVGTQGFEWAAKFERFISDETRSAMSTARMRAAQSMRKALEAKVYTPKLGRSAALKEVFIPLINDKSPLVSRYALAQMSAVYDRAELARILIGSQDPKLVRRNALQKLQEAGFYDAEKSALVYRLQGLWKKNLANPFETIGKIADDITRYTRDTPDFSYVLLQLSLLD